MPVLDQQPSDEPEGFGGPSRMHLGNIRSSSSKLFRAMEHIGQLQAAATIFHEYKSFGFSMQKDEETGQLVVWMKVAAQPPATIAHLLSDCIHNLRQSLDHLAYELAVKISGSNPPPNEKSASFPIFGSQKKLEDRLALKIGEPSKIPEDIRKALIHFQPFSSPEGEQLALLVDLDNRAKHRELPVVTGVAMVTEALAEGGKITVEALHQGPVRMGETEIARMAVVEDSGDDFEAEFWARVKAGIVFGDDSPAEGEHILEFVQDAYQLIANQVQPVLLGYEPLGTAPPSRPAD